MVNRTIQQNKQLGITFPADLTSAPRMRGELNNNPTNLDWAQQPWKGMSADLTRRLGERFAVFIASPSDTGEMVEGAVWGVRAAIVNMRTHERRNNGRITVRQLIAIWAPPSENDTGAYVANVARSMGLAADAPVNLRSRAHLVPLLRAIITVENGRNIYPDRILEAGIDWADGVVAPRAVRAGEASPDKGAPVPSQTNRGIATVATGAAGTAGAAVVEAAKDALPELQSAAYYTGVLKWVAIAIVIGGIAYVAYRVWRDRSAHASAEI